eukprot:scaffold12641_cov71-Phaeocystis_antarctica.AAC.4
MVPASMWIAPRATPSVRTTRCTWIGSCATRMLRRAISRACSGPRLSVSSWEAAAATDEVHVRVSVARGIGAAEGKFATATTPLHAASALWQWWLVWPLAQDSITCATSCSTWCCASSSARVGGRAVGFAQVRGGAVEPLEVLDGGPGGSEGGGDSDGGFTPERPLEDVSPAAPDGASVVVFVKRAAAALHVVHEPFLLGPQLLVPLLQLPLLLQQPAFLQPPLGLVQLPHLPQPRLEVLGLPEEGVAGVQLYKMTGRTDGNEHQVACLWRHATHDVYERLLKEREAGERERVPELHAMRCRDDGKQGRNQRRSVHGGRLTHHR